MSGTVTDGNGSRKFTAVRTTTVGDAAAPGSKL
jgi:hypothetical protein